MSPKRKQGRRQPVQFESIDRVILPAAQLQTAIDPFTRLGWHGIKPPDYLGDLPASCCFYFGDEHRLFHLEVAQPAPNHPLGPCIQRAVEESRGLCAVALRVKHLTSLVEELSARGIGHSTLSVPAVDNATTTSTVSLDVADTAGVPLVLAEYALSPSEQLAEIEGEDGLNHAFPIRRLDHLAAVAHNLDAQTHFWTHVLGVPLFGEVVTPVMIIRQFKIGDTIIELLGPATIDSPIHKRTPGLISMMSLEVLDLNAAVAEGEEKGSASRMLRLEFCREL